VARDLIALGFGDFEQVRCSVPDDLDARVSGWDDEEGPDLRKIFGEAGICSKTPSQIQLLETQTYVMTSALLTSLDADLPPAHFLASRRVSQDSDPQFPGGKPQDRLRSPRRRRDRATTERVLPGFVSNSSKWMNAT
jgi:hypothetical protein